MDPIKLQNRVVDVALSYVGMQEVKGNLGWTSEAFESKMVSVGWSLSHAWCAYFAELVWSESYDAFGYAKKFDALFSGSATKTYKQFEAAGWDVGTVPVKGAVIIWRSVKGGKPSWKGHAGILIDFNDSYMTTVEGNTNADGAREGEVVAKKRRKYTFKVSNGLELVGFIYPPGIQPHVPFLDKEEGDEFRAWVNDYHPEVAKRLNLDRSGSWFNSFITQAWIELGDEYDDK